MIFRAYWLFTSYLSEKVELLIQRRSITLYLVEKVPVDPTIQVDAGLKRDATLLIKTLDGEKIRIERISLF